MASRIAAFAVTGAAVLANTLPERTLPAVASASTLNVRLPVDVPVPAETVTAFWFEDVATSAFHAPAEERARGGRLERARVGFDL